MRAIDADAFDERVRVAGGMSEEELTEDFKDGVQAVLYMLSNQPTIQPGPHWIPVTERTPRKRDHKDDMVLVCNENGLIRFNTCINGTWVYGDPIAWMPLPEAFKGVTT